MASLPDQSDGFSGRFNHTACLWNGNIIVFGGKNYFKKINILLSIKLFLILGE